MWSWKGHCVLLLLSRVFYPCQSWLIVLSFYILTDFLAICSVSYWDRVLNFPAKIVDLSVYSLNFVKFCLRYFEVLLLRGIQLGLLYSVVEWLLSLWNDLYLWSYFLLWNLLSWSSIATLAFFWFTLAWCIVSILLFLTCEFIYKGVSCR